MAAIAVVEAGAIAWTHYFARQGRALQQFQPRLAAIACQGRGELREFDTLAWLDRRIEVAVAPVAGDGMAADELAGQMHRFA